MSLIPEEELKRATTLNLAPMVDFLFVVVAVFATILLTRALLYDTEIALVRTRAEGVELASTPPDTVNLSISKEGHYRWFTETSSLPLPTIEAVRHTLQAQHDPERTTVLLHIDREAQWEAIVAIILALRADRFQVHPTYTSSS